jgi:protein involved in polysaccharide export with SLBB domain
MIACNKYITLSVLLVIATLLIGCAGTRTAGLRNHFVEYNEQQKSEYSAAKPGEYRIQDGDVLTLIFTYLDDMNLNRIIVLSDGSVSLPMIDRVVLAGLTISEADSVVTARFAENFKNPDLAIIVEESVGRQVYVLGEVNKPGLQPVPYGGISILSAISSAGGFTDDAKKSNTILVRMSDSGYLCQEIDLSKFHTIEGISYTGVSLESYDVIYVPRSRIGNFVYFSDTVLSSMLNITRIISDVRFIDSGVYRR